MLTNIGYIKVINCKLPSYKLLRIMGRKTSISKRAG